MASESAVSRMNAIKHVSEIMLMFIFILRLILEGYTMTSSVFYSYPLSHKRTNTQTLSASLSLDHSHTLSLTLYLSLTHTPTHTHALTRTHTLTLSLPHIPPQATAAHVIDGDTSWFNNPQFRVYTKYVRVHLLLLSLPQS